MPRTDLHAGRLNNKLLRYFTERNPRLFYKKQEPSSEIDAVFTLLVDCSASMFDKMDETKRGIVLFHEALKSVAVPHQIVGFGRTQMMQPKKPAKLFQYGYSLPIIIKTRFWTGHYAA